MWTEILIEDFDFWQPNIGRKKAKYHRTCIKIETAGNVIKCVILKTAFLYFDLQLLETIISQLQFSLF